MMLMGNTITLNSDDVDACLARCFAVCRDIPESLAVDIVVDGTRLLHSFVGGSQAKGREAISCDLP